jgi:predicted permease
VPGKPDAEIESELQFHFEERIRANVAAGMNPDEARRAALERFGDVAGVRDECTRLLSEERRRGSRQAWLEEFWRDMRFALRSAARAPVFTILAIVTLALGIGANAAVFGVVKSVLLDALPYADADRLVRVSSPILAQSSMLGALSAGTVSDLRERQRVFQESGIWLDPREAIADGGDSPTLVRVQWQEPSLFATLGASFVRGTNFRPEDASGDTALATILSWSTWQQTYGADPDIVGQTVRLNGIGRTVMGVLERDFVMPEGQADYYLPLGLAPFMRDSISVRGSHNFSMVARLSPGVTAEAARLQLEGIGRELEELYAKDNRGIGLTAEPLRDAMVGDTRTPLLVLLASACLVILITCANLAGAMLSRAISRRKEFAVRVALGAGRARLVRQLLTESILLAIAGGIAGVLLAIAALALLRGLALDAIPSYASLSLDGGAVAVAFALALITGLAFGIGPALSASRADPQGTLRESSRGATESARSRQMRGVLVAGQMALCVSLLAAAGLLVRSLWSLTSAPIGFNAERALTFRVQLPQGRYGSMEPRVIFHDDFEQRLRALPGVTAVGTMSALPTRIQNSNGIFIQSRPWEPDQAVPFVTTARVSEDFFRAMGIPVIRGRTFTNADMMGSPPVMIVTQAFAQRWFPDGDAVGAQMRYGPPNSSQPWTTIIGIVGDVRNRPLALAPEPVMFFSLRQQPVGETYVVRTTGEPEALVPAVRRTLRAIDPGLPLFEVQSLDGVVSEGFAARRLPVLLMSGFAAIALVLAAVGVYAMFTSMAAAREQEFGVRLALGGSPGSVAGLVLRQGGTWMLIGLGIGALGIAAAARVVQSQLTGVAAGDPLTIGAAVLVLLVAAGIALLVPVRRAARVDPISVLR